MRQVETSLESGRTIVLDPEVIPQDARSILGMLALAPASASMGEETSDIAGPVTETVQPQNPSEDTPIPAADQPEVPTTLRRESFGPVFEMPTREDELISLAQSDSPYAAQAFGELFSSKTQWLNIMLMGKVPNFADRADIIQEAGLKAFKAFKSYDLAKGATFSSWILTIAYNAAVDLHRRIAARPQTAPGVDPERVLSQMESPDDVVAQVVKPSGFIEWILEEVNRIDTSTKGGGRNLIDVLEHIYLKDMSVQEYAALRGIPPGTVKSRLSHAYGIIRTFLPRQSQPKTDKKT